MKEHVSIYRDENGVPHVKAETVADLFWGQGYVHARDRGLQILMMRILGQGRVCELLDDSETSLGIDLFFRRMNWNRKADAQVNKLSNHYKSYLAHYCDGINAALSRKAPWELRLLGYKAEPWEAADTILLARMLGYLTLSQSQAQIERLLVEMVQAGVDREKLEALFPDLLGDLDMELLKKVKLQERIVPPEVLWETAAPRLLASNNWVVSGSRTASGKPILANDPHLEVNRLPAVWCELVLEHGEHFAMGGTMPGLPGILVGRTDHLAWGATYTFMDAVDSWVEDCRDGMYRRGEVWNDFDTRTETIVRKRNPNHKVTFYENEHGTLDGDPNEAGYYLTTRWSGAQAGARSMECILGMLEAHTAEQAVQLLGSIETSWNWVIADREGDIAYQMSGLMPRRRKGANGLVPLPGWEPANDWHGYVPFEELPRVFNPEEGFFVTANNDLNRYGKVDPINMPMADYRARRVKDLLTVDRALNLDDMFRFHYDVYSLQAERFMEVLGPLLPDNTAGKILGEWDLCYGADSQGAWLFERFYRQLYGDVFGAHGFGGDVERYLSQETGIFVGFYVNFDRVLLAETSPWFGDKTRDEVFRKAAETALNVVPETWGEQNRFMLSHMLFGGKLPRFLGFDRGPVTGIGSRATVHQGQIYRSAGRVTTFFASLRLVTDLAHPELYTNIAGGPSDRRFSRWYCSDLKNWLEGHYKTLSPEPRGERTPVT
ncbi:MAG: penicillin acylase family protein [Acidobacteriota bacterium]|nr:penicillin acylase family protein [Acidobacteriota bacterium]